jgi:hypothetical protein
MIMRPSRPLAVGMVIATGHFLLCLAIVPLTLKIGTLGPTLAPGSGVYSLLAAITRVLYFPIVTLALYPRHWFPGHWITVPIAINSLLWGIALALILVIGRRLRARLFS